MKWKCAEHAITDLLLLGLLMHVWKLNGERFSDFSQPFGFSDIARALALCVTSFLVVLLFKSVLRFFLKGSFLDHTGNSQGGRTPVPDAPACYLNRAIRDRYYGANRRNKASTSARRAQLAGASSSAFRKSAMASS